MIAALLVGAAATLAFVVIYSAISKDGKVDVTVYMKISELTKLCAASENDIACMITNDKDRSVTTCWQGLLSKIDESEPTLHTLPVCSGRNRPI